MIVTETNRYAAQYKERHKDLPEFSRVNKWSDVTEKEIRVFLALQLLTGVVRKPVSILEY